MSAIYLKAHTTCAAWHMVLHVYCHGQHQHMYCTHMICCAMGCCWRNACWIVSSTSLAGQLRMVMNCKSQPNRMVCTFAACVALLCRPFAAHLCSHFRMLTNFMLAGRLSTLSPDKQASFIAAPYTGKRHPQKTLL